MSEEEATQDLFDRVEARWRRTMVERRAEMFPSGAIFAERVSYGSIGFWECTECGAAVLSVDTHLGWHLKMDGWHRKSQAGGHHAH